MTDIADRVALPGSPDLDCDVDGLVLTAVVVEPDSQEILLHAKSGHGWWVDSNTGEIANDLDVARCDCRMRYPDMPPPLFAEYARLLEEWRDQGTPLRMTAAPGKVTLLIDPPDRFVPLPRRPDPASYEEGPCDD